MYKIKNKLIILMSILVALISSCKDLDEMNINPNGVDPKNADLNLLLPTIVTSIGQNVINLGFGDLAGVMQHTQYDGWSSGHNDFDWDNRGHNWRGYYDILRNDDEYYKKAIEGGYNFHKGVALILKAYTFGYITDLWGDAPYSEALKAEEGSEYFKPVYDSQRDIYHGILADLDTANMLLSANSFKNIDKVQDVLYHGDASKWRKFANSLALRYYMRLSVKEPQFAETGIKKITNNPDIYPLITETGDDANVEYIGTSPFDSWPSNTVFDTSPTGDYMRTKMCKTLVDTLQNYNDPRLGVWADKVAIPLVLAPGTGVDEIINGKRYVSQDIIDVYNAKYDTVGVDFDPEYVGIPAQIFSAQFYNLTPYLEQGVFNPHVSQLNDIYKETAGPLLLMRLLSAAEVNFILAEAAMQGWAPGSPEDYYNNGIQQSMIAWGVGDKYNDYIAGAPYNGLESIILQKWIASWTAAAESWFDYRRTGLPALQTGESAKHPAFPLRFYYNNDNEIALNPENAKAAIEKLERTEYAGSDGNNSAWSKTWLLQGTGLPY